MRFFELLFVRATRQHYIAVIELLQRPEGPGPRQPYRGAND